MNRFSLAGRKALVTGASRGIGRALALALAEAGAEVFCAGRDLVALETVAAGLREAGYAATAVKLDVSTPAAVAECFAALAGMTPTLDILVNNAGVEDVCPSLDVDEALWDKILNTNLKGAFFCAQAAARMMSKGGAILNLCSLTSEVGVPTAAPYGASKSGLVGVTRALAAEWAPLGIRVNGIGPGYFRTSMTEVFYENEAWAKAMLAKIPLARFGELEDLAGAAVFLCSPASSYITGQVLYVDGGYLASI
ncbi:SDR family NAD(P)-dependent oxidoreductase [Acidocella aromatica]|uniref:Gluconate 5-dehydrogenase n=1 Tax=Acidocella aromatica TaxID=1303579 RepID=A0A840V8F6_9PROT|nr:SDR family oxidoreductase [Acidocella aromatica]MBB5372238.1 gluconate 5-dehydrogenase [Acidocella aromatica]